MASSNSAPHELQFAPYLTLLAKDVVPDLPGASLKAQASASTFPASAAPSEPAPPVRVLKPRFRISNITQLAQDLLSPETSVQANITLRHELRDGQHLEAPMVDMLAKEVERQIAEPASKDAELSQVNTKIHLLNGLKFLAPFVARDEGRQLWDLVKDVVYEHDPKLRALWGDVRAALGCDPLFSPQAPYLLLERFKGHTAQDEPIPGFVRIPAGPFTMGSKDDSDNQPNAKALIDAPFYIHRTPVTVAQFDAFVEDGGYTDTRAWWDKQGLAWRNGAFNSKITDINFQQHLARRGPELRQLPMDWSAQLPFQSRPVTGVTWFEARAYARWLSAQLQSQIKQNSDLDRYQVLLPTELQWERAARATSPTESDQRNWPWGNKEKEAEQAANLANQVGQPSAVGVYPPSSIGLYDMGGNVWEWQDNLYRPLKDGLVRLPKDHELTNLEEWEKTDRPTLRGGSWFNNPELARCSFRYWNHPDGSGSNIGLRVVLSLPISGGSGS